MSSNSGLRFLFWCAHEHLSFRIPEFEALARTLKTPLKWIEKSEETPWIIVDLQSEAEAKKLLSRSISTKYCIQIWGDAPNYEKLLENMKTFPESLIKPYCGPETSFKVCVDAFRKKLTMKDKIEKIERFSDLPVQGPVNLKSPDVIFSLFEYYGYDNNAFPDDPIRLFFGRCVGEGQRDLIIKLSLKDRCFIGNTSMDPTLSLLMANLAGITNESIVIDPFVGSGSLLVAAAQFGAKVLGSDIDYLMLHAKNRPSRVGQKKRSKGEHLRGNFEQYGIASNYVDIVVGDNAAPPWRHNSQLFDAIITDPPYGIREPTERIGTHRKNPEVPKQYLEMHFPQKVEYHLGDIFNDLLSFAANSLVEGGRLVFWIPVNREHYAEEKLPSHQNLKLVANCEQVLSSHTSRRCLVLEKISCNVGPECLTSNRDSVYETVEKFKSDAGKGRGMKKSEKKDRIKTFGHLNLENSEDS